VLVTVSARGEIQRIMNTARKPRSGSDYAQIVTANNRHEMLLIGANGRAWRLPIHQLPEKTGQAKGEPLAQLLSGWERGDEVAAALDVPTDESMLAQGFLTAVTRNGRVVRVSGSEIRNLNSGTLLVNLEKGDRVLWAGISLGEDELLMVSAQGQAIRFKEDEVRPTGLGVQGVWGMKLEEKNDRIVGAGLASTGDALLIVSESGMAKRTAVADYPVQGRYGKGVRAMNLDQKTGLIGAAAVVTSEDRVTLQTNKRTMVDVTAKLVSEETRYSQGGSLAELPTAQRIAGLFKWGSREAWPGVRPGIETASESTTQEESGGRSPHKKRTGPEANRTNPTVAAAQAAGSSNKVKKSGKENGQQLSLALVDGSSNSDGGDGKQRTTRSRNAKKPRE
jgi:DNA gyrase subunit A